MSASPADPNNNPEPTLVSASVPPPETSADGSTEANTKAAADESRKGDEGAKAQDSVAAQGNAAADAGAPAKTKPPEKTADKPDRFWLWVIVIATLLCLELYIYGRNGRVEVCVGVEGVTDFAAKGQARTKENMRKLPQCAERLNLGMYNNSEELAKAALLDACGRATMTNREELANCMEREKKWTRRVNKHQVAPWDSRLYRRLLWLD